MNGFGRKHLVKKVSLILKVVFNAVNQALEPNRPRGEAPFFIERSQEYFRLNPKARIIVDADLFLKEISQGTLHGNENAFNLYQGRYFEVIRSVSGLHMKSNTIISNSFW